MKYASVCSGIEAPTMAWHSLGWEAAWFSEIEPFPCAVLKHHYPKTPNLGDMTKLEEHEEYHEREINLLVGGTPCQSFSVAGLRAGLSDDRGNLALEFCRILLTRQPRWFVWENVPGVFSSGGGEDFKTIIEAFTEVGYGVAWRVLDAQYFGVAQRRRRVFVVGHLGDWRPPARVLFEPNSLRRLTAQGGETGKNPTANAENGFRGTVGTLCSRDYKGPNSDDLEAGKVICGTQNDAMRDLGFNISPTLRSGSGGGAVNPCVAYEGATTEATLAYGLRSGNTSSNGWGVQEEKTHTLDQASPHSVAYAYSKSGRPNGQVDIRFTDDGKANTLNTGEGCSNQSTMNIVVGAKAFTQNSRDELRYNNNNKIGALAAQPGAKQQTYVHLPQHVVRRLTPVECARLQGFPDTYLDIPWKGKQNAPTGLKYKALGNSMAVPVMRWIGKRIDFVDRDIRANAQSDEWRNL